MDTPPLDGRRALVTGASGGLGQAIATVLARAGARVALHHHTRRAPAEALARRLRRETGETHPILGADLSRPRDPPLLVERAHRALGGLDLLVNNAGVSDRVDLDRITVEMWDHAMDVNLRAAFLTGRAAAHRMTHGGAIVNVGSTSGLKPGVGWVHYNVSKAALGMLTKCQALAYAPNIRVNCVAPGLIAAGMNDPLDPQLARRYRRATPRGRIGTAEDAAHTVAFLAGPAAGFITGQILVVDGGRVSGL
ncbi:MAG: SDR family oxidoreductase [Euryarchaeota archaeon]|nr:SDR family oxidoreductase [Euryarchaeota archaeon]